MITRRQALLGLAALAGTASAASSARASLARGLGLERLVIESARIVLGEPLDATSGVASMGGRKVIVTETRVRVREVILARAPLESGEVVVRTLGGIVGNLGETVSGQAELTRGEACLLFLCSGADAWYVTGMAQGHYPIRVDSGGTPRLLPSRRLPSLRDGRASAVARLVGADLPSARALIRRAAP